MPNPPTHAEARDRRRVIVRDFFIFQFKLLLDGVKDLVLVNAAIIALIVDLAHRGRDRRLYAVMRMGERFDLWLNLYGPARHAAEGEDDGLFGASPVGAPTFLGRLEQAVRGGDEPGGHRDRPESPNSDD